VAISAVQNPSEAQVQPTQNIAQAQQQNQTQPKQEKPGQPQDKVTLSAAAKQAAASTQQAGSTPKTRNGVPQQTPKTGDVDHDGDNQ
jgi:hypothetical protein